MSPSDKLSSPPESERNRAEKDASVGSNFFRERPSLFAGSNRSLRLIALVLLGAALLIVSGLFWMRLRSQFVIMGAQQGVYLGRIHLSNGARLPLAIDIDGESDNQRGTVIVLIPGFTPVTRSATDSEPLVIRADPHEADPSLPAVIELSGRYTNQRGGGDQIADGQGVIVGTSDDDSGRARGRFAVAFAPQSDPLTKTEEQSARAWVLLQAEYQKLLQKQHGIERQREIKQQEIARLQEFVKDRPRLRQGADEKFKVLSDRLDLAQRDLQDRQSKAERLSQSLVLAQRVTPFGRLVTLGRESAAREMRWVESMLRAGGELGATATSDPGAPTTDGVAAEVSRGREILGLQRAINDVRMRIAEAGGDPDAH